MFWEDVHVYKYIISTTTKRLEIQALRCNGTYSSTYQGTRVRTMVPWYYMCTNITLSQKRLEIQALSTIASTVPTTTAKKEEEKASIESPVPTYHWYGHTKRYHGTMVPLLNPFHRCLK